MVNKVVAYFCALLLCNICVVCVNANDDPVVTIDDGKLVGKQIVFEDKVVNTYLGIPYAQPPVGDRRFKKPEPVKPWEGAYQATKQPPHCAQGPDPFALLFDLNGSYNQTFVSEDCLYLNVWTPVKDSSKDKLPVMVWIYGGGFETGSTDVEWYDGSILASVGNVVVVTINYRVNIFGFLYSGDEQAPGNQGLMDQALGIKWVHDNIGKFGGDRDLITVFGESAGSISTGLHLISPMSSKYVKRVIMESGNPFMALSRYDPQIALYNTKTVATSVNCTINDKPDINCLRKVDVYDLVGLGSYYGAIVGTDNEFMPFSFEEMAKLFTKVNKNVLIGVNKDEFSMFLIHADPERFTIAHAADVNKTDAIKLLPKIMVVKPNGFDDDDLRKMEKFYFDGLKENDYVGIRQAMLNFINDPLFFCPNLFFNEKVSKSKDANVYHYYYSHVNELNMFGSTWIGAFHASEIPFVFGLPLRDTSMYTIAEQQLSLNMIKAWTSFAKNGKPNNNFGLQDWSRWTTNNQSCVQIDGKSFNKIVKDFRKDACEVWRKYLS